jgi:predicted nucleic acid-binding protein
VIRPIPSFFFYFRICSKKDLTNRPFDDQSQERIRLESEAVLLILERCQGEVWQLLGSDAVDYEVSRIPDREQEGKVMQLGSVAKFKQPITDSAEARAKELEGFGFMALDALHLACAEAGDADVLLTTDDKMVSIAKKHRDVLHVRVENPILWLTEVMRNGAIKNDTNTDSRERP